MANPANICTAFLAENLVILSFFFKNSGIKIVKSMYTYANRTTNKSNNNHEIAIDDSLLFINKRVKYSFFNKVFNNPIFLTFPNMKRYNKTNLLKILHFRFYMWYWWNFIRCPFF